MLTLLQTFPIAYWYRAVRGKIQFWCLIQFAFHPIWWIGVWLEQQCKQFWMCIYNLITIWYHQIFFSHVTKKDWWLHATWILGYTQNFARKTQNNRDCYKKIAQNLFEMPTKNAAADPPWNLQWQVSEKMSPIFKTDSFKNRSHNFFEHFCFETLTLTLLIIILKLNYRKKVNIFSSSIYLPETYY